MKLYLDSFLYDLIERRNEARDIRRWRRLSGHEIGVSIHANIAEAPRIEGDLGERDRRVRTIMQVGAPVHPPYDYRHYREIADELWRLRPTWFRQSPAGNRVTTYLRRRRHEWVILKDPSRLPDLRDDLTRIRHLVGRDMGRQKKHRQRPKKGADWSPEHSLPDVQACIDERSKPDAFWRYVGAEETQPSFDAEIRRGGHLEWLTGFNWPQPRGEYHRFWICDADSERMPLSRIVGLAEYFQRQRRVTAGNPFDRLGHAPHLLGFDVFLTTDRRLFEVLNEIRAEMSDVSLSRVVLVDSEASSALEELKRAVG